MIAFSHAVLASAALLVSIAGWLAAPLLAEVAQDAARIAAGGRRLPAGRGYRELAGLLATGRVEAPGEGVVADGAVLLAFAAVAAASLLVPGFCTGTLLTRSGDLVLVAALLVLGRLASLVAELASGRSAASVAAATLPAAATLLLPALLPVVSATAALGSVRTDALPAALAAADPTTRILLAAAIGLAAFADLEGERQLGAALSGPVLAVARVAGALRLLVWADLLGLFVAPSLLCDALDGPLAWAGSLAFWAVRSLALAALLGVARAAAGRLAAPATTAVLGAAALLALLAAALVFIGQSFA